MFTTERKARSGRTIESQTKHVIILNWQYLRILRLSGSAVTSGTTRRQKWILGHQSRTTTEIYLHSIGESEREAMEIYERVTEKSHTQSHTETEKGLGQFG